MKIFQNLRRLAVVAFLALSAALTGCSQIDTGAVGVSRFGGKTTLEELPQGWHLTWFNSVDEFTVKQMPFVMNDLKPRTKDNMQIADMDVDVYVQPAPNKVAETVTKYVGDVVKASDVAPTSKSSDLFAGYSRVFREVRSGIYDSTSTIPANEINKKRVDLEAAIVKRVQDGLEQTDPGAWIVVSANIRGVNFSADIDKATNEQVKRDMEIAAARKLEELEEARAAALVAKAEGEAQANRKIAESLTPLLVRMREIEAQRAFAGQGTHTVLLPANTTPLVSVNK